MAATAAPRTAGQSQASPGGTYLYPHPLSLARSRAEAERIRVADADAYSAMCATWGSLGGLTTYYRYGADYFRLLARRRWHGEAGATAEELAAYRTEYRTAAKAGRS